VGKGKGFALWKAAGLGVVRHPLVVILEVAGHGKRGEGVKVEVFGVDGEVVTKKVAGKIIGMDTGGVTGEEGLGP